MNEVAMEVEKESQAFLRWEEGILKFLEKSSKNPQASYEGFFKELGHGLQLKPLYTDSQEALSLKRSVDELHYVPFSSPVLDGELDLRDMALQGRSPIEEVARALSHLEAHPQTLVIHLGLSPKFLTEISKIRALRLGVLRLQELVDTLQMPLIHVHASLRYLTYFSAMTNQLRNTVACFSALLGTADRLTLLPYDAAHGGGTEDGERLAEHSLLIASLEAQLGGLGDALSGSYAIENLTEGIASAAWALAAEENPPSESADKTFPLGEVPLIGLTHFADGKEGKGQIAPGYLGMGRLSEPYEALRLAGLEKARKAYLLSYGKKSQYAGRAAWLSGLLAASGLEVIELEAEKGEGGLESLLEGYSKGLSAVVLLALPNQEWEEAGLFLYEGLKARGAKVFFGGNEKDWPHSFVPKPEFLGLHRQVLSMMEELHAAFQGDAT